MTFRQDSSAANSEFPCSLTLEFPFPTLRLASVAHKALSADKELSPLVRRTFETRPRPNVLGPDAPADAAILRVCYSATTNRMLRVSVNSFLDSFNLVLEVMEKLDNDVLEEEEKKKEEGR